MLGTFICWYDFIIFGLATPLVFHKLFFPNLSFVIPILVFAVGFVIRPLGSIVFGHIGDKIGRKPVLIATMLITGVGTVFIGLLPTYADIGVWAAILLVALRVVQSFALGGEQGAGSTILVEHNINSPKRGFIASVVKPVML
jgi:MFS family permease